MNACRFFLLISTFLLIVTSCSAQCDWAQKVVVAIQRRYQTSENACKAVSAPPEEFDRAHALIEREMLSQVPLVSDARLEGLLDEHSQRMISFLPQHAFHQHVGIAAIAEPNAFATGQNVTFHADLVAWYLSPQEVLAEMGYRNDQIAEFLQQYGDLNPGESGLIGVLAHETSHNLLGHPDVRPLVLACEDFMNAGTREIHDYEQLVSTGHKGSRFSAFFRGMAFVSAETLFGSQRQQQLESDADELGVWLAYRDTGDPLLMSKSLCWLSMYPGMQGGSGVSEIMCSDHPQLVSRVEVTSSLAHSVQSAPLDNCSSSLRRQRGRSIRSLRRGTHSELTRSNGLHQGSSARRN